MAFEAGGPWVWAQVGAREHYAVPCGLRRLGCLDRMITDLWCSPRLAQAGAWMPGQAWQRFRGRFHPELDAVVQQHTFEALGSRALGSVMHRGGAHAELAHARWFSGRVGESLRGASSPPGALFCYDLAAMEAFRAVDGSGTLKVLGQVDPGRDEWEIVLSERERFPGWQLPGDEAPPEWWERQRQEWGSADLIIVNSDWSRSALIHQGADPAKIAVVPLAYEAAARASSRPGPSSGRLQALWLGTLSLRKGIQYLFQAARLLAEVDFHVAGSFNISREALAGAPSNVRLYGPVPRIQCAELYERCDLFLLPTLSDGFAVTQLEAMAHGLPVIATAHCGDVVRHGENGLRIPARDPEALVEAVHSLDLDRARLAGLSEGARATLASYTLEGVTQALLSAASKRRQDMKRDGHAPA